MRRQKFNIINIKPANAYNVVKYLNENPHKYQRITMAIPFCRIRIYLTRIEKAH